MKFVPDNVIALPTYPEAGKKDKMVGDALILKGTVNM
jgi:hypothetical protein